MLNLHVRIYHCNLFLLKETIVPNIFEDQVVDEAKDIILHYYFQNPIITHLIMLILINL
jgi:hypothetical protein